MIRGKVERVWRLCGSVSYLPHSRSRSGFLEVLTVVRDVTVALLEDQVDAMPAPAYLFHRLAVGHSHGTVPIDLHQLVTHLRDTAQDSAWRAGTAIHGHTETHTHTDLYFMAP